MEFFRRARPGPARLGILAGTFNPVTVAHLALARTALEWVDEVVFVLPRAFPHKGYSGASFEERLELLGAALAGEPALSIAATNSGLFVEIAEEFRAALGPSVSLCFLCGRDAAERIAGWDYGRPNAFPEMLHSFGLLVAARQGEYVPPPELAASIRRLELPGKFDHVSATEVRERIASGAEWEHLVPCATLPLVRRIYGGI